MDLTHTPSTNPGSASSMIMKQRKQNQIPAPSTKMGNNQNNISTDKKIDHLNAQFFPFHPYPPSGFLRHRYEILNTK